MRLLSYPSRSFTKECSIEIANRRAVMIEVSPAKVNPIRRYLARINRDTAQPTLLVAVVDNVRIYDFVAGVAEAVLANWRFSHNRTGEDMTVSVEPPE